MRTRQINNPPTCSMAECDNKFYSKTYCSKHYLRYIRYGNPLITKKAWTKQGEVCAVKICKKKPLSRGYCSAHYYRFLHTGDPGTTIVSRQKYLMHGGSGSPEYRTWVAMKDRCNNPKNISYKNYGGRGITVCEEWQDSFMKFYEYLGPRPEKMSIERIDVNGNYEPGNVKWADTQEQAENKRNTVLRHRYKARS